jgi:sulfite exporter TauE/SafE
MYRRGRAGNGIGYFLIVIGLFFGVVGVRSLRIQGWTYDSFQTAIGLVLIIVMIIAGVKLVIPAKPTQRR